MTEKYINVKNKIYFFILGTEEKSIESSVLISFRLNDKDMKVY